jgi:hypothetical protein
MVLPTLLEDMNRLFLPVLAVHARHLALEQPIVTRRVPAVAAAVVGSPTDHSSPRRDPLPVDLVASQLTKRIVLELAAVPSDLGVAMVGKAYLSPYSMREVL